MISKKSIDSDVDRQASKLYVINSDFCQRGLLLFFYTYINRYS